MADVEATVEIEVEGAGSLRDAAEAARSLADALKQAEASAGSISGAFGSAAEAAGKLRNDAEEAAKALKSIRDAGLGVGDVAATLGGSSEAASKLRDDLAEAEDALSSLVATGPGAADIAAFLEADESAAASLRTALQGVADAEAEVAAGGAGMGDGAAGLEAEAAAAGHLRDNLIEADAAQSGMAGHAGSIEKTAADMRGALAMMEQGQTSLVSKIGPEQFGQVITKDATELEILGGGLKNVKTNLDDLGDTAASRLDKLNLVQDFLSARSATDAWAESVRGAKDSLEEAEPAFKDAEIESSGLRDAISDLGKATGGGGFVGGAFSGWMNLLKGSSSDLEDVAQGAGDAAEGVGGFGDSVGEAFGPVASKLSPMTGMIGGLIGLVGGLGPAFATAAAGGGVALGGFAALALPTLSKIETSYENVATARKTWTLAEQVAQADPTKTNLEEAATDAAKLKVAYADVPATIRPVIAAFGNLKSQYDSMAKSFQPEVLKVTGDALSAVSEGMSQFLKPAAQLGGGLLDKGIKNLQTFMESPGAVKTFNDLLKETPGAVRSAGSALSSLGKFAGDAFGGEGLKGSESFIKSFDGLLKAIGPGAGTAVKGLAGGLQDIMNDATQAAPQIGKIAGSLGALEKVNLSSLTSQVQGLLNLGNQAGGGEGKGKGNILTQILGDADQYEKDYAALPKGLTSRFGTAAKQALSDIIPGLGSGLKPQTLHWPVTVDPKVDVKSGHIDKGALEKSLGAGGAGLPLQVKVEPKFDPEQMQKSLTSTGVTGGKVPVPAEAKVDKADTSGLKGGDTKVPATAQVDKVDTSGINKAASNVKIHGVTVDLSDAKLSGLTALSSSLQSAGSSAGKSFDTGLASGISGGAGQAESAARTVVSEIKSALSQLGGDGSAAGAALGAGLASGIAASTGAAVAAARSMAEQVTAAVKAAHATASPSKVFKGIGADDVKGLIQGLEGGKSELDAAAKDMAAGVTAPFKDTEITDTIKKLETDLKDSLKAGDISKTEDTGVSAWLSYDNKRLMNLASQRKNIEAAISAEDALYKSVDTATVAGANVATFASNAASGGSASSDSLPGAPDALAQWQATGGVGSSIQSQLKQYLSQTRAFTSDVKKLKAEGLDQTSLTQLLQAGVSGGGLSGAQMLLSGGPKGVKEVASLQNQISQAAKQLGTTGANAAYESGSQIGGGLASGLKAELGSVTDAIKSLATSIVDEMQKGLSSGALENIGKDWASQIAKGMSGGGGGGSGGGGGAHAAPILSAAGGTGGGTIHVHLNVGGTEIAQVVQTYTLQHARRNTGSGLQLRGRGT